MDIIRNANVLHNILDEEDMLLLENHSLDKKYKICFHCSSNVTRLMLLVNFLAKYPQKYSQISNIIEQYVKEVPGEINKMDDNDRTALGICIIQYPTNIKIIKIMLNNSANINQPDGNGLTIYGVACYNFNIVLMRLILEYDGINVKTYYGTYQDTMFYDNNQKEEIAKINQYITLLNTKN